MGLGQAATFDHGQRSSDIPVFPSRTQKTEEGTPLLCDIRNRLTVPVSRSYLPYKPVVSQVTTRDPKGFGLPSKKDGG